MDSKPESNGVNGTEPSTFSAWFKQNRNGLLTVAIVAVLVFRYLHPLDVLLAGGGLSFIIFLHELGHFLAAKWCDVHVKTFSIGFGPALPFCSYKYGETTYKIAMIPLGGFVSMVGEGESEVESEGDPAAEEAVDRDPRSFKNKPVGQRMLIISAGVIMNLILGAAVFTAAYLHGVQEMPAVAGHVESGSAAWQAGIHTGTDIERIDGRVNPWFDDIRPIVSSTSAGETVSLDLDYEGQKRTVAVEPLRIEGALFPQLGIRPPESLTLRHFKRDEVPPFAPASPASEAKAANGSGFLPGDRIVAMTDPADESRVSPMNDKLDGLPGPYFDYARRLEKLAGKPITFQVVRKDQPEALPPTAITVAPTHRWNLGLRMRMGPVGAIRQGSPAATAGIQPRVAKSDSVTAAGDRIVSVEVPETDGTVTRFVNGAAEPSDPKVKLLPLDPLRLPYELNRWSDRNPGNRKVTLAVLREVDHTEKQVTLTLEWDPAYRYDLSYAQAAGAPIPVNGLGLAYHVQSVVDAVLPDSPAAAAGLQPNDKVVEVKYKSVDAKGKDVPQKWGAVGPLHWAFVDNAVQNVAPHEVELKVERSGQTVTAAVKAVPDTTWPTGNLGLELMPETRIQKAGSVTEALEMGAYRTYRSIKMVYLGLYSMVFGRISPLMMSGPLTLARASYFIAGEDVWHLLIWIGLISVNLAVVNFLPIPVLDGGHMVFLVYEWLRGKPAPEWASAVATYAGLAVVGCLMLFVMGLDIWRWVTG